MKGAKILLIEDDQMISDALRYGLEKEGFVVTQAFDGATGLRLAQEEDPDLLLLDIMLPELNGLEVCREVRRTSTVPILMVTARGEEKDQVAGLELGADDYIVKPFGIRQLIARIRANLRRVGYQEETSSATERIAHLGIDLGRRVVSKDGEPVHLSYREFELLAVLYAAKGDVVARDDLLNAVWGQDWIGDPRTLDVHMRWLREKLEQEPSHPKLLLTARNVGYRLVAAQELA